MLKIDLYIHCDDEDFHDLYHVLDAVMIMDSDRMESLMKRSFDIRCERNEIREGVWTRDLGSKEYRKVIDIKDL